MEILAAPAVTKVREPADEASGHGRRRAAALVATGVVLVGAVGTVGAALLTRHASPSSSSTSVAPAALSPRSAATPSSGAAHTAQQLAPPVRPSTGTATPNPQPRLESPSSTGRASSKQHIKRVLARYTAAYDRRDAAGLGRLFAADLVRRPGDGTTETRAEALAIYEKQLGAVRHPRYVLDNITVDPGNRASAHYLTFNGARQLSQGAIIFSFTDGEQSMIRAIDITPGAGAR